MSARAPLRVGAHVSIAGGLFRALERGAELRCDVIQIFARSNQQWAARPLSDEALEAWHAARAATGVAAEMVHGCYLVNLASPDAALRERSLAALADEVDRCDRLGIPYLVLHPGAHMGAGEAPGLRRVAAAFDRLWDRRPDSVTTLLVENTAGQGSSLGHRFEHLRDLFAQVRAPERLGVCIDTCHTFAAGYDLRTARAWEATFAELDRVVGCDRVRAFHVNDSVVPLGARVDRHEQLGAGHLGLTPFRLLVNDARFRGLPMTIETPKPSARADELNLALLRALDGSRRVRPAARALATELAELATERTRRGL